jgi:pyrimidine operon attenuation protein/uracil phosphoribosyltransferase
MSLPDAESVYTELADKLKRGLDYHAHLVGIHSGGAWIAERLAKELPGEHPIGFLDVSFYRDDYGQRGLKPKVQRSSIPFDVAGKRILLVDDVLYTGRSVRAALNELFDYGRPASVELAVLIDRGGRELPVEAQYVGARIACLRDAQIVLARDGQGRFALELEAAKDDGGSAYA